MDTNCKYNFIIFCFSFFCFVAFSFFSLICDRRYAFTDFFLKLSDLLFEIVDFCVVVGYQYFFFHFRELFIYRFAQRLSIGLHVLISFFSISRCIVRQTIEGIISWQTPSRRTTIFRIQRISIPRASIKIYKLINNLQMLRSRQLHHAIDHIQIISLSVKLPFFNMIRINKIPGINFHIQFVQICSLLCRSPFTSSSVNILFEYFRIDLTPDLNIRTTSDETEKHTPDLVVISFIFIALLIQTVDQLENLVTNQIVICIKVDDDVSISA